MTNSYASFEKGNCIHFPLINIDKCALDSEHIKQKTASCILGDVPGNGMLL